MKCLKHLLQGKKIWKDKKKWYASKLVEGIHCNIFLGLIHGEPVFAFKDKKIKDSLNPIIKVLKKYKGKEVILKGELVVENSTFYAYDLVYSKNVELCFHKRYKKLKKIMRKIDSKKIKMIKEKRIRSKEHLKELIKDAKEKKWKGIILHKNVNIYYGNCDNKVKEIKIKF